MHERQLVPIATPDPGVGHPAPGQLGGVLGRDFEGVRPFDVERDVPDPPRLLPGGDRDFEAQRERGEMNVDVVLVALSASYLTLGVAAPDTARGLWAVYAVVTTLLAVLNLVWERTDG